MKFDSPDNENKSTSWINQRTFSLAHAADIYNVRNQTLMSLNQFAEFWAKRHGEDAVIQIDGRPQRVVSKFELE